MIYLLIVITMFLPELYIGMFALIDVVLFLTILIEMFKKTRLSIKKADYLIVLLLIFALIPFILFRNEAYFDVSHFWLSLIKQFIYIFSIIILRGRVQKDSYKSNRLIKYSIIVILLYSILKFAIYHIIPQSNDIINKLYPGSYSYGRYRETGVYSEPAGFTLLALFYFYLVYSDVKISKYTHILIIVVFIISQSFTVIGFYLTGIVLLYLKRTQRKSKVLFIIPVMVLIGYIFIITNDLFKVHLENILTLNPSSAVTRLFGGIELMFKSGFSGVGFGNIENYVNTNKQWLNLKYLSTTSGTITNSFASIQLSYGWIGLVLFMFWLYENNKLNDKTFLIYFIISFFTTGTFNSFIFFISILIMNANQEKGVIKTSKSFDFKYETNFKHFNTN